MCCELQSFCGLCRFMLRIFRQIFTALWLRESFCWQSNWNDRFYVITNIIRKLQRRFSLLTCIRFFSYFFFFFVGRFLWLNLILSPFGPTSTLCQYPYFVIRISIIDWQGLPEEHLSIFHKDHCLYKKKLLALIEFNQFFNFVSCHAMFFSVFVRFLII